MEQNPTQPIGRKPMTIGKFAQVSDIPVTTLRFWDEVGIFKPAIVDPESNYRYYTIEQIPLATDIYFLTRRARVPLDEALAILEATPEQRKNMLEQHLERLGHQIAEMQTCLIMTQQFLLNPEKQRFHITLKALESQSTALVRLRSGLYADRITSDRKQAFTEIYSLLSQQNTRAIGPPFSEFPPVKKFDENDFEVWVGVAVAQAINPGGRVEMVEDRGGTYACALHQGHYYFLGEIHMTVRLWMQEQGKEVSSFREYYLYDPKDTEVLEHHPTEVCYQVS